MLKAIAVDDDVDCLFKVKTLLNDFQDRILLVDTCTDVEQAFHSIRQHQPDVLFLDVEIGNRTGFDLLEMLGNQKVEVIFTTAFENYASKAFMVHALHYLQKPLKAADFQNAIERIEKTVIHNKGVSTKNFSNVVETFRNPEKKVSHISIEQRNETIVIQLSNLIRLEASENYCLFFMKDGKKHMASKPLKYFAHCLEEDGFLRTHKTHLLNPSFIDRLDKDEKELILTNDKKIPVSRSQLPKIKDWLKRK